MGLGFPYLKSGYFFHSAWGTKKKGRNGMNQLEKRPNLSVDFNFSKFYAYESLEEQARFQAARQDATDVQSREDREKKQEEERKKREEERKRDEEFWKTHSEPCRQVALAIGAGAATGGVGGVKGAAAGSAIAGIASVAGICGSCHRP